MEETTSTNPVLWRVDERGVAYVTLNRPQVYNAYNGDMIAALLSTFDNLAREPLRVAVITGNGRNFQAGADINWLDAPALVPAGQFTRFSNDCGRDPTAQHASDPNDRPGARCLFWWRYRNDCRL